MVFTLPEYDSYGDANSDSCTEKVTIDGNGMPWWSVLNGYRTHLSQPRPRSRFSGNPSELYH